MSIEAIDWVPTGAPAHLFAFLMDMANHADSQGEDARRPRACGSDLLGATSERIGRRTQAVMGSGSGSSAYDLVGRRAYPSPRRPEHATLRRKGATVGKHTHQVATDVKSMYTTRGRIMSIIGGGR